MLVVDGEPVRLDVRLVYLDPEPLQVLPYPVVHLGYRGLHLGARVLVAEYEVAVVHLGVLVAEDDGLGAAQVEGAVRVGGEAGLHHLEPVDVLQGREGLLLLLPPRLQELGPALLQGVPLPFDGPGVDLAHYLLHDGDHLLRPGPQLRELSQDLPDDGADLGLSLVAGGVVDGVLQRVLPDLVRFHGLRLRSHLFQAID